MKKLFVSLMLLGLCGGGAAQAASNTVDDQKACTATVSVTPEASTHGARWAGVTINDFIVDKRDLLVRSDDIAMKTGQDTKLQLKFVRSDLGKKVTIKGLALQGGSVSEKKQMSFRQLLKKHGIISDGSCLSPTDPLLKSSNAELTPLGMGSQYTKLK